MTRFVVIVKYTWERGSKDSKISNPQDRRNLQVGSCKGLVALGRWPCGVTPGRQPQVPLAGIVPLLPVQTLVKTSSLGSVSREG